jgi:hypothetical protein
MKRAEHLRKIIEYHRPLDVYDKLILSTDQERSLIYIYQANVVTGENHIEIYNYENNIVYANKARTLPQQIQNIYDSQVDLYGRKETTRKSQAGNYSYYVNAKHRDVVSSHTHIKTNAREPVREDQDPEFEHMTYCLERQNSDMFMLVESKGGAYLNIRVKQDHNLEQIHFQMYTKNKTYYTFFFTLINEREKLDRKHTYFAVRKTIKEVEEMGIDNHESLIKMDQEVTIFLKN